MTPRRVLLVDDDADIRDTLGMLLETAGHDVHLASGGLEALEVMGTAPIDVAIVDLMMPKMDGESLVREMRARGCQVPVLVVSASTEIARVAQSLGAFGYLAKPFQLDALERLIVSAVQHDAVDE